MKTIICRISAILLLLVAVCGVNAQVQVIEGETSFAAAPVLSAEDNAMLQRRAAEKVGQMCDYISFIATKSFDYKTRLYYSDKALNLFIAQGKAYNEIINGVKIKHEGVEMEVTSANRATKKSYLMRDYLPRMAALKYDSVMIQTTEVAKIKVTNLKKIGENLYSCTCYFDQAFAGFSLEGKPRYIDITRKRVECFIFMEETLDGIEYSISLGNVTAESTQRASSVTEALKKITL